MFTVLPTGELRIEQGLDYDASTRRYDFTITADDPGPTSHPVIIQATIIVTPVNEHPPVIVPPS